MTVEDRVRFEEAVNRVLRVLKPDTPMTTNEISRIAEVNWKTADKAVHFVISIQDHLTANEVVVLGGRGRKIVLLQMRVELSRLPKDVADWFIETKFFRGKKERPSTEEVYAIMAPLESKRVSIEEAVSRTLHALEMEDELSVLELSKRTGINRRTVARVLDLLLEVQNHVADFKVSRTHDGTIIKRKLPDLHTLDNSRMVYVLKRRYLPDDVEELPENQERALLQMA